MSLMKAHPLSLVLLMGATVFARPFIMDNHSSEGNLWVVWRPNSTSMDHESVILDNFTLVAFNKGSACNYNYNGPRMLKISKEESCRVKVNKLDGEDHHYQQVQFFSSPQDCIININASPSLFTLSNCLSYANAEPVEARVFIESAYVQCNGFCGMSEDTLQKCKEPMSPPKHKGFFFAPFLFTTSNTIASSSTTSTVTTNTPDLTEMLLRMQSSVESKMQESQGGMLTIGNAILLMVVPVLIFITLMFSLPAALTTMFHVLNKRPNLSEPEPKEPKEPTNELNHIYDQVN